MTKILDNGSDQGRMNVVLVAEGYTAADRPLFETHAKQLADRVKGEPWYRVGLLNIHALWVASKERAPTAPTGEPNDTAFRAYYGGDRAGHVISGNDLAAKAAVLDYIGSVPRHTIVLVNSLIYGGKGGGQGGNIMWTYASVRTPQRWTSTALHELGHSLFGLADEYGGPQTYHGAEPREPNVTMDPRGAKWRHILDGAREGAMGFDKGIYRPTPYCRMRAMTAPYCAVCEDAVIRKLEEFLTDAELPTEPVEPAEPDILRASGFDRDGRPTIKKPVEPTEPEPAKTFRVVHQGETKSFVDDISGIMAASQWLLGRKFGTTRA